MIQSKLKWTVIPLALLTLAVSVLVIALIINFESSFNGPGGGAMVLFILTFTFWMLLYQTRVQTQKIVIDGHKLTVKNWAGFGKEKQYDLKMLSGFHSSALNSKAGNHKAVYLMSGKHKIACVTEFYHKNFDEINNWATANLKYLGFVSTTIFTVIRDSLTVS